MQKHEKKEMLSKFKNLKINEKNSEFILNDFIMKKNKLFFFYCNIFFLLLKHLKKKNINSSLLKKKIVNSSLFFDLSYRRFRMNTSRFYKNIWRKLKILSNDERIYHLFNYESILETRSINKYLVKKFIFKIFIHKRRACTIGRGLVAWSRKPYIRNRMFEAGRKRRAHNAAVKKEFKRLREIEDWKERHDEKLKIRSKFIPRKANAFVVLLNAWKSLKKYKEFSFFKISNYKIIQFPVNYYFVSFYKRNWKKMKKMKPLHLRYKNYAYYKRQVSKKMWKGNFPSPSFFFFPRNYRKIDITTRTFPKNLQKIFFPHNIILKRSIFDTLKFLQTNYFNNDLITKFKREKQFIRYYLKFKKKRNNFYFTIFNHFGEVVYNISSGKFSKLTLKKRNKKLRTSLFNLPLLIKHICKALRKKKIFKIHVFIKPNSLKRYNVRKIYYNFVNNRIRILNIKNPTSFSHGYLKKNKKVRRL